MNCSAVIAFRSQGESRELLCYARTMVKKTQNFCCLYCVSVHLAPLSIEFVKTFFFALSQNRERFTLCFTSSDRDCSLHFFSLCKRRPLPRLADEQREVFNTTACATTEAMENALFKID